MQNTANATAASETHSSARQSCRNVWIWTAYAGALLGLLGVLAYHFATNVVK